MKRKRQSIDHAPSNNPPYRRPAKMAKYGRSYGPGYQPGSAAGPGPENKWWDHGADITALNTAPSATNPALYHVLSMNQMAAGDDGDQRNGNKITINKINLRMKVKLDENSDLVPANVVWQQHVFRVILYLDVSPNGQAPTWDQMFQVTPNNQGQLYAYNNLGDTGRFKILMDKWLDLPVPMTLIDGSGNMRCSGSERFFKKTVKLNVATRYTDATNNLSAIQRNNIGMWICSDATTTSYPQMKFSYRARVRFRDN